ncbi:hypothetical protein FRA_31c05000 [Francisella sp. W12-1067]|nr:hypothetical protein FRA_31c05000 [Francisella sp. W12-1067]
MFLLAINKNEIENNDFSLNRSLLRNITQSHIDQPIMYNEDYYMIPWFYLYKPEEIINNFLVYAYEFEMLDAHLKEPTVLTYQDIYIRQCLIFLHPILGKVPEQLLTTKVNANILANKNYENQLNVLYNYLSGKNKDLHKTPTKEDFIFEVNKIMNNEIFFDFKNDASFINEAEYFITYPCIQLAFKHIAMKSRNIATGNFTRSKMLVEELIKDKNNQLYNAQVKILKKWKSKYEKLLSKLSPEEIDTLTDKNKKSYQKKPIQEQTLEGAQKYINGQIDIAKNKKYRESLNNNEYFQYYRSNKEAKLKINTPQLKTFYDLLEHFIEDFEKINVGEKNALFKIFPKVALGAMLINDTRKVITSVLADYKHNVDISTVYTGSNWETIKREEYKLGVLGKAPSNNMAYNHYTESSNVIATRNKACYETGMVLGNGVSGHMASILDIHDCKTATEKMTIACSMLIFWDKFYDRQVTNAHSYIEVFESIMYKEDDYSKKIPKIIYTNFSGDMFTTLVTSYCNKTFNPVNTLSLLEDTSLQKDILAKKNINDKQPIINQKFSSEEIYQLFLALQRGETIYLY